MFHVSENMVDEQLIGIYMNIGTKCSMMGWGDTKFHD